MESRIIKLYDYHDLDLSQFKTVFHPDEDRIQKEMKKKQVAKSVWVKSLLRMQFLPLLPVLYCKPFKGILCSSQQ